MSDTRLSIFFYNRFFALHPKWQTIVTEQNKLQHQMNKRKKKIYILVPVVDAMYFFEKSSNWIAEFEWDLAKKVFLFIFFLTYLHSGIFRKEFGCISVLDNNVWISARYLSLQWSMFFLCKFMHLKLRQYNSCVLNSEFRNFTPGRDWNILFFLDFSFLAFSWQHF